MGIPCGDAGRVGSICDWGQYAINNTFLTTFICGITISSSRTFSKFTVQWAGYSFANGTFESPFYPGTWGQVPGPWRKDAVHVQLGDETYLVMFLSEKWSFVAVRCRDEQVSYGRLDADPIPEKRLVW